MPLLTRVKITKNTGSYKAGEIWNLGAEKLKAIKDNYEPIGSCVSGETESTEPLNKTTAK